MNIYSIASLFAFLSGSSVAAYVYIKNRKQLLSKVFALEVFLMSIWCLYPAVVGLSKPVALIGVKFVYASAILNMPVFTQFCFTLLGAHNHASEKKFLAFLYYLSIFLVLSLPTSFFIKDIIKLQIHYSVVIGKLFSVFSFSFILVCLYNFYRLLKARQKVERIQKNQFKYFIVAFVVAFVGAIMHFLSIYIKKVEPFPHDLLIIAFVFICAYAIVRHQLLDINIVIKRTIVYSSLITLITIIYILAVFLTERVFNHIFGYASIPMGILVATLIALIFIPLKNQIQHVIEKYFFKGTLDSLAKDKELMHQELMRSERLKAVATLAAGMAHEIKNPLTAIKTFTEHLEERKGDPAFIEKFKRIVGGEVDKINDLVHSLLDFAKPNPLKFETSNINYLLEDTLSLLNNEIIKHKITLVKKYSELPLIQADSNQLKQAFLNLILNAIEAMTHGGELTIETVRVDTEEKLGVNIKDTGAGIPQKDLPRIFDPFYSTKNTGTGLGLSITYEIIKKHNGTITAESETGKGTTVKIRL